MSRYKWQRHSTYGFKTTFVMISNKHEQFRKKKKFKFYGKKIISIHVSSAFDCLWSGYSENVFDMIIQCELLTQMKKKKCLSYSHTNAPASVVAVSVCGCVFVYFAWRFSTEKPEFERKEKRIVRFPTCIHAILP